MYLLWNEIIDEKIKIKKMYIEDKKDFKIEIKQCGKVEEVFRLFF